MLSYTEHSRAYNIIKISTLEECYLIRGYVWYVPIVPVTKNPFHSGTSYVKRLLDTCIEWLVLQCYSVTVLDSTHFGPGSYFMS